MELFRKKNITQAYDDSCLARCLSAFDLVLLGIGAIIGAGVFVLTGIVAATQAGPAIILSYIVAGFACGFAALSYAELASAIGGCGSAYGYAYAGFGELFAWIIGWDLLLEYAISVSAVSVGWSGYFNDCLRVISLELPFHLIHNPAQAGIFNVAAFAIIMALAGLLIYGMKTSSRVNNLMVLIKLLVIFLFIVIALSDIHPQNWVPFMPFGWKGVIDGASLIFFAYIGFDAVSTTAEEVRDPQRSLPIGIIGSLFICTFLYIIVSGLLTGMASYKTLNVASPISHVLLMQGYKIAAAFVSVGALAGLTTVMLVLFYGLSRIFLAMARDGLLPSFFAVVNPRTKTPARIIIFCGLIIGLLAGLISIDELAELVNIGTLFAFITVCMGVIVLRYTQPDLPRSFKTPLMPIIPCLGIVSCLYLIMHLPWFTLLRFLIWMLIGMIIYFGFSRFNSVLNKS